MLLPVMAVQVGCADWPDWPLIKLQPALVQCDFPSTPLPGSLPRRCKHSDTC